MQIRKIKTVLKPIYNVKQLQLHRQTPRTDDNGQETQLRKFNWPKDTDVDSRISGENDKREINRCKTAQSIATDALKVYWTNQYVAVFNSFYLIRFIVISTLKKQKRVYCVRCLVLSDYF